MFRPVGEPGQFANRPGQFANFGPFANHGTSSRTGRPICEPYVTVRLQQAIRRVCHAIARRAAIAADVDVSKMDWSVQFIVTAMATTAEILSLSHSELRCH